MSKQNLQENKMQNLKTELNRVIEFNKLMGRKVGNRDHLFLQSQLLVEEGIKELSEAAYQQDSVKLRNALADAVVVAMGGAYIAEVEEAPAILSPGIDSSLADIFECITDCVSGAIRPNCDLTHLGEDFLCVIDGVVSYAEAMGIDLVADLKAVNNSDLSKFCKSTKEAASTMRKYKELGVSSEYRATGNGDYPFAVYATESKGGFLEGELLKSVNYQGSVFS